MTILDDLFNASLHGEPARLDATIRDQEQLQQQFTRLLDALRDKGLITAAEEKSVRGIHESPTESRS